MRHRDPDRLSNLFVNSRTKLSQRETDSSIYIHCDCDDWVLLRYQRFLNFPQKYFNHPNSVLTLGTVRCVRLVLYTVRHHFRIRSHYSFSPISLSWIVISCASEHRSFNEKGPCTRTGNVYNIPKLQGQAWFILPWVPCSMEGVLHVTPSILREPDANMQWRTKETSISCKILV